VTFDSIKIVSYRKDRFLTVNSSVVVEFADVMMNFSFLSWIVLCR